MHTLWQDVRFSARVLARHRGFTCTSIAVLALGIGVNAGVFGLVNSLLLRPRVSEAEWRKIELVLEDREFSRVAPEEIVALVRREGTFEEVEARAHGFASEAREALAAFPECDARRALEFAPDFVLHRRA